MSTDTTESQSTLGRVKADAPKAAAALAAGAAAALAGRRMLARPRRRRIAGIPVPRTQTRRLRWPGAG